MIRQTEAFSHLLSLCFDGDSATSAKKTRLSTAQKPEHLTAERKTIFALNWCLFKEEAQRTESWVTVRKPKDRRNGRFLGVERRSLNPAPSFLLRTLSARFCERIEGCGKKVE